MLPILICCLLPDKKSITQLITDGFISNLRIFVIGIL
jgi:hypothetical protein